MFYKTIKNTGGNMDFINEQSKEIITQLRAHNKTIAFMESCTGGFLANSITNVPGASDILKVSLVTYSSEYKIKFGVTKDVINKYTVYSIETATEMAKRVAKFANSNIGVGVTGELGNTTNKTPKVYYSIYFADEDKNITKTIDVLDNNREEMKHNVATSILTDILEYIRKV